MATVKKSKIQVGFFDPIGWDYDVQTALSQPLPGSQSALTSLAIQLATETDFKIYLFNHQKERFIKKGVVHCPVKHLELPLYQGMQFDFLIVLNSAAEAIRLAKKFAKKTKVLLWTQHDSDQPAAWPLLKEADLQLLAGIVFVSAYQKQRYLKTFRHLSKIPCLVIPNAFSPPMGFTLPKKPSGRSSLNTKKPYLIYTSTPYRGLSEMLDVYEGLKKVFPTLQLKVFSSMTIYRYSQKQDEQKFKALYARCRATPGVKLHNPVGKRQLAKELGQAVAWIYPNTFAETSCVAALEALVSGTLVITNDFGALKETLGGFGKLVEVSPKSDSFIEEFVKISTKALRPYLTAVSQVALEEKRKKQILHFQRNQSWRPRAVDWKNLFYQMRTKDKGE